MKPLVSVISVNYNGLEVTCEMLRSIRENSYDNFEVIVVDNASRESPKATLNRLFPEVKVLESKKNLGFAGGNNLGIRAAKGDYILFLNNDAELTDGAVEAMLALFEKNPKIGVVSPKICYFPSENQPGPDRIQYVGSTPVHPLTARNKTIGEKEPDNGQYTESRPTAYAHGAAMMVSRKVIEQVGGMPESFFLYYEELDWCEQIRRAGFDIYVTPSAKIYHKESWSVGKFSTLQTYYLTRNRVLFMRRNRPAAQMAVFCLFLLLFTLPRHSVKFLIDRDIPNFKALWRAVFWNLKDRWRQNRSPQTLQNTFVIAPSVHTPVR